MDWDQILEKIPPEEQLRSHAELLGYERLYLLKQNKKLLNEINQLKTKLRERESQLEHMQQAIDFMSAEKVGSK